MSSETNNNGRSSNSDTKPVKTFRHGTLQVSIWKSYNSGKPYYNGRIEHRYNANRGDGPDDWKSSDYINSRDMPAAVILWTRASNYIAHQLEKERAGN